MNWTRKSEHSRRTTLLLWLLIITVCGISSNGCLPRHTPSVVVSDESRDISKDKHLRAGETVTVDEESALIPWKRYGWLRMCEADCE